MEKHQIYMQRCLELALLGAGHVAPNPMVGAVLVADGRIIGEGYHQEYGKAHAEVNCIASVREEDLQLLNSATMYVSLEPCAHFGKTPPCADLIIAKQIPEVVIGCRDPFSEVDGKGIEKLLKAGVRVVYPVMEEECLWTNRRFMRFHTAHRPYIILKWAQTLNGIMGKPSGERLLISNEVTNRLVHKWRSEEAAIMVGTNTALADNPALSNRLWTGGQQPARLVLDMNLRLPKSLQLFDGSLLTIVLNGQVHEEKNENLLYYKLASEVSLVKQIAHALYHLGIQSVLVEGGARLLQSFIDEDLFDELRIITNTSLLAESGLAAPLAAPMDIYQQMTLETDLVQFFSRKKTIH